MDVEWAGSDVRAATAPLLRHLLDDAALFPPGNAPMPEAVARHRTHQAAWYADLVGVFLCTDVRLDELVAELDPADDPLRLGLIVRGTADALPSALATIEDSTSLELAALELGPAAGPGEAEAILAALAAHLPDDVEGYLEVRPDGELTAVLDVVAGSSVRAKLRTGGTTAEAFPSEEAVARVLCAATARQIACKFTAGLHHLFRHTDPRTGFEHHGFGNVLLAVDAAHRGSGLDRIAAILAERDTPSIVASLRELGADRTALVRRSFSAFGTCSVTQPLDDLVAVGLLEQPAGRSMGGGA